MQQTTITYLLVGIFSSAAIVAMNFFMFRWIFSMKRQLWNQRAQINLLIKLCEKMGVNPDDDQLSLIKEKNNNPDDHKL